MLCKIAVESRHGVESVFEYEFGEIGRFLFARFRDDVAHAHRIDIAVERFAYIHIEKAGKIIFVVTEHVGEVVERELFGKMVVNIVEDVYDGADVRSADGGYASIMGEQIADDDIDIAFFDKFGSIFLSVERGKKGQKRAVEFCIAQMRGQSLRLEDALEVVGIARPYDEDIILIRGGRHERMRTAFVHENDVVCFADEFFLADGGFHRSRGNVEQFDAAVEVQRSECIAAFEKFYFVRPVVPRFIKRRFFHDVNKR